MVASNKSSIFKKIYIGILFSFQNTLVHTFVDKDRLQIINVILMLKLERPKTFSAIQLGQISPQPQATY